MSALKKIRLALLSGTVAFVAIAPAYAQESAEGDRAAGAADQNAQASGRDGQDDSEIVVTGSRITRNGYEAPTPVTVVTAAELTARAPTNIPDALYQLPQFGGSSGQNRGSITGQSNPNIGNYMDLRALTPRRTLILFDGLRVPPTSFDGSVNADTLPQYLVDRVDVVTGGASAVYGSDAVVGVVNFVLDDDFEGFKANAQYGFATMGGDRSYKAQVAAGASLLDDRLHLLASAEYFDSAGLPNNDDRPLGGRGFCRVGATGAGTPGTASNPFTTLENCRSQIATSGGFIVADLNGVPLTPAHPNILQYIALAGQTFQPDGSLEPFNFGGLGGVGGSGIKVVDVNDIVFPLETNQGFARIAYDIDPNITIYAQAAIASSTNGPGENGVAFNNATTSSAIPIFSGNAFLSPDVQSILTTNGVPGFQMSRWPDSIAAAARGRQDEAAPVSTLENESINFTAGIEGETAGINWNVAYVHGDTTFRWEQVEVELPRLLAAVDAVFDPSGAIVCNVTLTNPGLYPGCVPINLFGEGAPSQAALDYVTGASRFRVENVMDIGAASASGTLFDNWAGPVSFAVGGEYRRQTLDQTSNSDPADPVDTTGLRGAPSILPRYAILSVGSAHGEVTVSEAFAEVLFPVLHDSPLGESLDLNGAYRYTDYSTSGGVSTWKFGVSYTPIHDLRLRATVSEDIRAPSLYELFAGPQGNQRILTDPHTGVTNVAVTQITGNTELTPEIGRTNILGFVYQPSWAEGLGISVDFYEISITDAIAAPDVLVNLQDCENSGGTAPVCDLIVRPLPFSDTSPANFPLQVGSQPFNLASIEQRGIDFEISYGMDADRIFRGMDGRFELRALGTYTDSIETDLGSGQPIQQSAGYAGTNINTGNPKLKGLVSFAYTGERLSVLLQERFTGSYRVAQYEGDPFGHYQDHGTAPNRVYTDLTLSYNFLPERNLEGFLTVNNLFNEQPPLLLQNDNQIADLGYPTRRATYDVVGRYITLGMRLRL